VVDLDILRNDLNTPFADRLEDDFHGCFIRVDLVRHLDAKTKKRPEFPEGSTRHAFVYLDLDRLVHGFGQRKLAAEFLSLFGVSRKNLG
jgi:hypothetical protein